MTNEWHAVLAALANPDARSVYAEIVLGAPQTALLSAKKRERAVTTLCNAGLISVEVNGDFTLVPDAMAKVLARAAEPRREGVDRFIRNRRIERYPMRPTERQAVLKWVADDAFQIDEVLTEPEVNERLAPYDADVAALRRYLVDEGLLLRTKSGTSYSRS